MSDLAKLKKILFDFKSYQKMNKDKRGSQGQAILQLFEIDLKTKFEPSFILDSILKQV